jgi:hypothetical protein
MVLEMLEMLEIPSIRHKCPMDIFKGSMNFTKNAHFNRHSLPHHKWCDICKPQNPLFFKFQKNPQKQNILDKMQNGHF